MCRRGGVPVMSSSFPPLPARRGASRLPRPAARISCLRSAGPSWVPDAFPGSNHLLGVGGSGRGSLRGLPSIMGSFTWTPNVWNCLKAAGRGPPQRWAPAFRLLSGRLWYIPRPPARWVYKLEQIKYWPKAFISCRTLYSHHSHRGCKAWPLCHETWLCLCTVLYELEPNDHTSGEVLVAFFIERENKGLSQQNHYFFRNFSKTTKSFPFGVLCTRRGPVTAIKVMNSRLTDFISSRQKWDVQCSLRAQFGEVSSVARDCNFQAYRLMKRTYEHPKLNILLV